MYTRINENVDHSQKVVFMKKLITLFLLSFLIFSTGCKKKPLIAGGQRDVIIVLAGESVWSKTEKPLKEALERDVFTPNRETIYKLMHGVPENFSSYMYAKNLILISYLGSESDPANLVSTLLTEEAIGLVKQKKAFIFEKTDPWASGQYLLVIASAGKPELADIVDRYSDDIFRYFEDASYYRAKDLIYSAGRQKEKEEKFKSLFRFSIELPTGFFWAGEDSVETFVKLIRRYPTRLISIGWLDTHIDTFTFDHTCTIRDSISALYYEQDIIVKELTQGNPTEFLGREGYKLEGIWENNEKIMGGPFRTYFFNDSLQQRCYVVDIHVYAPDKKKWFYLMELESIASTFETFPIEKRE
jgi:hypothetical protein